MAQDHYGVDTLDELAAKIDPGPPRPPNRSMEDFCQAWWGKSYADCIHEILLNDRFLNLERQSSLLQTPGATTHPLRYFGGDILGTVIGNPTVDDRRIWVGADFPITNKYCINLSDNTALIDSLPFRNHSTSEFKNGEVDLYGKTHTADAIGAGWRSQGNDTWATPNQTAFPGTIYWVLDAAPSTTTGILYYAIAWLVETPTDGPAFFDLEVKDTHILPVNVFGTANLPDDPADPGVMGIGPAGDFYMYGFMADTSFNYYFGLEFDPPAGDFTPNHGQNSLSIGGDTEWTRIARLPVATAPDATGHTGTVYTDYEFWTGSGWSTDLANAAKIVDTGNTPIRGYFHATKIATGHYLGIAQDYPDVYRRCYYSSTPTGPWWNYRNIWTPFGPGQPEAGMHRASGYNRLLPGFPAKANHVMTMTTNLVWFAVTKVGKNINEMDTPYVIQVPTKDAAEAGTFSPPPLHNIRRMRHMLVR
jgi:hypothetical protein